MDLDLVDVQSRISAEEVMDEEFGEFFPVLDDQERFARTKPVAFNSWDKVCAVLGSCLAGAVLWALLAVFCWGGNLVPRW